MWCAGRSGAGGNISPRRSSADALNEGATPGHDLRPAQTALEWSLDQLRPPARSRGPNGHLIASELVKRALKGPPWSAFGPRESAKRSPTLRSLGGSNALKPLGFRVLVLVGERGCIPSHGRSQEFKSPHLHYFATRIGSFRWCPRVVASSSFS